MDENHIRTDARQAAAPASQLQLPPNQSTEINPFKLPDGTHQCPVCWQPTSSLKIYRIPELYFLLVVIISRTEIHSACPRCMRRRLLRAFLLSIFGMNLLAPLFWPGYLFLLGATFTPGDSSPPSEASRTKVMLYLLLVVVAVVVLAVIVSWFQKHQN